MRKYAVSAPELVFPAPKQLPVTSTVWMAVVPNAPTVAIAGVHGGADDDGDEDDDLDAEGEGDTEGEGDVEGGGGVEGGSGVEGDSGVEGEGDGAVGDSEGDVETGVVRVPVG